MRIKILFFSAAAEVSGTDYIHLEDFQTTDQVIAHLLEKFPSLSGMNCRFALNKVILNESNSLNEGDELAVLPPFSGG